MTLTATRGSEARPSTRTVAWVLAAEVALGLALGFYRLGDKSFWYDEGFSAMATSGGVLDTIDVARDVDANMPLYLLGLSVWRVFGDGEAALRSFSVVAAAAAVVAVYLLASRLFDRTTGLLAGFLLALAPFAVRYSQEARGYSLLVLLATLASYCFVRAIETRATPWFAWYAVVAAAACYSHLAALFVIAAHAASLPVLGRKAVPVRPLVLAGAALGVMLVPLAYIVRYARDGQGVVAEPTLGSIPRFLANVSGGWLLFAVLAVLCVSTVAFAVAAWRSAGPSLAAWRPAFVVTIIVVPFVGLLAGALVTERNWADRYLILMLPGIVVAAAFAMRRLEDRRVVAGLLAVIAVLAAFKVGHWYTGPPLDDWRGASALVARSASPADGIVFCLSPVRVPFEYYALREPPDRRPRPLSPADRWGSGLHMFDVPADDVAAWRSAPQRVWVVSRYASESPVGACDLASSMAGRSRVVRQEVGEILVERYDR